MNNNHHLQNQSSAKKHSYAISESVTAIRRLRNWLGLERNIMVMLITVLILGMGEELWIRFVPKYLELLGASAWIIAVYGALKDLLDAIYQYPGGWLADRLGRKIALVLFCLLAIVGYSLYLLSHSWEWILFGAFFVAAWSSLNLPAIFSIIGDNLPQTRRAIGFGVQSILKRAPIVLALPIGGWCIASLGLVSGVRLGLVITIALALTSVFIVLRCYREKASAVYDTMRFREIWYSMDARLKRLLVADCLVRFADGITDVFIILYVTNILGFTAFTFGWLTSVQMLTAILIYIPIAKLSDRMNRKPFILVTFFFFALFPLMLASAANFFWIVLAFVTAGLREIGEPARKALIVDMAQETTRGRTVGIYYLFRGFVVFPASLAGGRLWTISHQLPFYVAFILGMIGFVIYAIWGQTQRPLLKSF